MRIRAAEPSDAAALARVHVETWRSAYRDLLPAELLANLSCSEREAQWREILSAPTYGTSTFTYVAEADFPVAFASGGPERTGDADFQAEIYAAYVHPDFQEKGIGKRLLQELAQRFCDDGLLSVLVWVLAENPARGFYEALGGQAVRRREIEIGGCAYDEVGYGWEDIGVILEG